MRVCVCAQRLKEGSSHSTLSVALSLTVSYSSLCCTHFKLLSHTQLSWGWDWTLQEGRNKRQKISIGSLSVSSFLDFELGQTDLKQFFLQVDTNFLLVGVDTSKTSLFVSHLLVNFWTWTGWEHSKRFVWIIISLYPVINLQMPLLFSVPFMLNMFFSALQTLQIILLIHIFMTFEQI